MLAQLTATVCNIVGGRTKSVAFLPPWGPWFRMKPRVMTGEQIHQVMKSLSGGKQG